jgi:hypothetical protein
MIQYERDNVTEMQRGQGQNGPLVNPQTWQHVQESHAHLSPSQRATVEQIVAGRDKIMGLEGGRGWENNFAVRDPRSCGMRRLPSNRTRSCVACRHTNWRNQELSQARSNAISFGPKVPMMDRNGSL